MKKKLVTADHMILPMGTEPQKGSGSSHVNFTLTELQGAQILCAPCEMMCPRGVRSPAFLAIYDDKLHEIRTGQMAWTGRPRFHH